MARYSEINQRQWELLEEKKLTREQVLLRRFQLLFRELRVNASCEETQRCYENMLAKGHDFMPGAPELLERLVGKYRLYLVSNGTAMVQDCRLRDSGIGTYFQGIFISERVGVDKPQKEFFDRSFATIPDFDPSQAVIIGDSLTSDMRGGINAGITTCWYNPRNKPRRADIPVDFEIDNLMESAPAAGKSALEQYDRKFGKTELQMDRHPQYWRFGIGGAVFMASLCR